MPYTKKKGYRMHCREQTLAGLASRPDGSWAMAHGTDPVYRNAREGTIGGEPGVKRPQKGGRVRWSTLTNDDRMRDWTVVPFERRGEIRGKVRGQS